MEAPASLHAAEATVSSALDLTHTAEKMQANDIPIIRDLGRMGLDTFVDRFAIETQLDNRGFVDYRWLLSYMDSLVPKGHIWSGELDVHHLQWEAHKYSPSQYVGQEDSHGNPVNVNIPSQFREIPFHKLLIPRQMHQLAHLTTLPPKVPEFDEMERRLRAYDTAESLFQSAKRALEIEEQEKRLMPINRPGFDSLYIDTKRRRTIKKDILIDRYLEFASKFHAKLSAVTRAEVEDLISIELASSSDPTVVLVADWQKKIRVSSDRKALRPRVRWLHDPQSDSAA